jgi:hypothetical protein
MPEKSENNAVSMKPVPEIATIEKIVRILRSEGISESAEAIAAATGASAEDACVNLVRGRMQEPDEHR